MNKNNLANIIHSPVLALTFYTLIFYPIEYLITQKLFILEKIPEKFGTIMLILFLFYFHLFDNKLKLFFKTNKKIYVLFVAVILIGNIFYSKSKTSFEQQPRIFLIRPSRGVQGQQIKINSINLMSQGRSGKAFLGDQEIFAKQWTDKVVVIEQPVMGKFGKTKLYLMRFDGKVTNSVYYTVLDPGKMFNWKSTVRSLLKKL